MIGGAGGPDSGMDPYDMVGYSLLGFVYVGLLIAASMGVFGDPHIECRGQSFAWCRVEAP